MFCKITFKKRIRINKQKKRKKEKEERERERKRKREREKERRRKERKRTPTSERRKLGDVNNKERVKKLNREGINNCYMTLECTSNFMQARTIMSQNNIIVLIPRQLGMMLLAI